MREVHISSIMDLAKPPCKGKVYSYTVLNRDHVSERFQQQTPIVLALIMLDNGEMVTAQITDLNLRDLNELDEQIQIDMPVEPVVRKLWENGDEGIILYGYKFRASISSSK